VGRVDASIIKKLIMASRGAYAALAVAPVAVAVAVAGIMECGNPAHRGGRGG